MKRNLFIGLFLIVISIIGIIIFKDESAALRFKNDYESVNGKENAQGKIHRTVSIPSDNPFITTTSSDILTRIENKETFYVYFGSKLCPWCRSTIEKAIEVAGLHGVTKIFYVDIWDDNANEIVRDKYILNDDEVIKEKDGDASYAKLLELFDSFLSDYTLTNSKGEKIAVGEKRIYAPNYIYVEKGIIKKLVTGISSLQNDSREDLTKDIQDDEEAIFNEFFTEVCDSAC